MAIAFALATALCNATAVVLQRSAARSVDATNGRSGFSFSLIVALIRKPLWLLGLAVTIGATVFWVLALNAGDLSFVQPIMVIELAFIVALLWAFFRSPVAVGDWVSTAAVVIGLGIFLYVANPQSGNATPGASAWALAAALGFVVVSTSIVWAQRGSPTRRAALYGAATAITYAYTAALIKTVAVTFHGDWSQLFVHWPVYLAAVVGATGFVMEQHAFQAGPLTASQPALVIGTPIVSIMIGVWLFHERLSINGIDATAEAIAFLVMTLGIARLTQSSLMLESRA